MNKTKAAILLGIILLVSSCLALQVNAHSKWYTITNDAAGGVQLGNPVTVTATTNNEEIVKISFNWTNPAGDLAFPIETTNVQWKWQDGHKVYYATSIKTPNAIGDWIVEAEFIDEQGYCWCKEYKTIATRTTSFNVVPEVPLLGTAGVAIAMVLGLTVYKKKQKQ